MEADALGTMSRALPCGYELWLNGFLGLSTNMLYFFWDVVEYLVLYFDLAGIHVMK